MPLPIDYLQPGRSRNLGAVPFSDLEDPAEIRNPYALERANQNADLRLRRAAADRAEFDASPDRQRIDRIQQQQDADYDLENGPAYERARAGANIDRMQQEQAAEGYFDPWRSKQREREQQDLMERYQLQYADPYGIKRYKVDTDYAGKMGSAGIRANAQVGSAQLNAGARARGQMVDPDTGQPFQGQERNVESIDTMITGQRRQPWPRSLLQKYANEQFGGDIQAAQNDVESQGFFIDENQ